VGQDSEVCVLSPAWLTSLGKPSPGDLLEEWAVPTWGLIGHFSVEKFSSGKCERGVSYVK